MLGGVRGLSRRRFLASFLTIPVLLATAGAGGLAALSSHSTRAPTVTVRSAPAIPGMQGPDGEYLRSLPHDLHATAGAPRFSSRPPARLLAAPVASSAIPGIALDAYAYAARLLRRSDRSCHLSWEDLAGIGRVESDNGLTYGSAARVSREGTLTPPILGPVLDGSDGMPAYPSPDHGRLEQGGKWERAVGPMQFLPSTWVEYAVKVRGHGPASPQNYYDAAVAAGVYLCANGGNLGTVSGFDRAVYSYNHSDAYVALVRSWATYYAAVGMKALRSDKLVPLASPPSAGAVLDRALEETADGRAQIVTFKIARKGGAPFGGEATIEGEQGDTSALIGLKGFGEIHLVEVSLGGSLRVEVKLPRLLRARLHSSKLSWFVLSRSLEELLPPAVAADLEAVAVTLPAATTVLSGVTSPASVTSGRTGDLVFSGHARLGLAAGRTPAAASWLRNLEVLTRGRDPEVTAWLGRRDRLGSVETYLPELVGVGGPVKLTVRVLASESLAVIDVPRAVEYSTTSTSSTSSTSTTTTSTTSTTTSTTSTTTTTTSTTTTSTTTTTTTAPSSSSAAKGKRAAQRRVRRP